MKEINIDRVYPLNRHYNIKILHGFNLLKSFASLSASLDLHRSKSLISQLCLDNSGLEVVFARQLVVASSEWCRVIRVKVIYLGMVGR